MTDAPKRLVERDADFEKRHEAAMREATMARRYRAAYLGIGLFLIIVVLWGLRLLGLF